jgi:hypothetical protein
MTDRKIMPVYVRQGAHEDERTIAFRIPEDIPAKDLLDAGFAIDGNSAVLSVTRETYPSEFDDLSFRDGDLSKAIEDGRTLTKALRDCQQALVAWLDARGYDVEFR